MFFTSYEFLFLFIPISVAGFYLLLKAGLTVSAEHWLILSSLVFYWSLDGSYLATLVASVLVNYGISSNVCRYRHDRPSVAFGLLWAGIAFNVAFLIWCKYAGLWFGSLFTAVIPLGVSFFSIQQIAYLVSTYNEDDRQPPLRRYLLFVVFFPYVVAGPIVTKQEVLPQFSRMSARRSAEMLLPALTMFSLGLFKKVVIADNVGPYVDNVFDAAGNGVLLSAADAWCGALLFSLQLYFDFSGYSDMAAGLSGLFGVQLPRNFNSPFKAHSIIEFWRRWHMSATRFFTNFVYLPLVVKLMRIAVRRRLEAVPQYVFTVLFPMLMTFVLIGIWHGAGTTAAVFGLLMGVALSVNHVWTKLALPAVPTGIGWALTLTVVVCGMVFSRADDMNVAMQILQAMAGFGSGAGTLLDRPTAVVWLAGLGAIALFAPNTHEIMAQGQVVLDEAWGSVSRWSRWQQRFQWSNGPWGTVFTSLIFCISVISIPRAAEFLYYRF